jgi:putative addiction module component (TIGR02574 family)
MTTTAENILNQALTLDDSERAQLAERLWESVEPAPADLTDEQKAMLDRRWEEITSGKVECRPFKETISELRQKLHARHNA